VNDDSLALESAPSLRPVAARAWLSRLAAILATLAVAEVVGTLLISSAGDSRFRIGFDLISIGFLASVVLYAIVGALIVRRRPATIVAWLMIAIGLGIGTGILLYGYGTIGMSPAFTQGVYVATRPLALEALIASQLFFQPSLAVGITLLLLLFPTDRFLDPRWRLVAIASAVGSAVYDVGLLFLSGELDHEALPGLLNPLAAPEPIGQLAQAMSIAGNALVTVLALAAALSLVARYRRADAVVAAQIRWVAVAAGLAAIALATSTFLGSLDDLAFGIGVNLLAATPIAIGIAITRYRLYDIDRLINRALVYGSLTAILAGVFTAGISLAQRLFVAVSGQSSDAAIVVATLVVATIYAPLRKRLEAFIDARFKFEQRRFGAQIDEIRRVLAVIDPVRAAERLASVTVRELDALGAAVVDGSGHVMATAGPWPLEMTTEVPISAYSPTDITGESTSPIPSRGDEPPIEDETGRPRAILVGPRAHGEPHDPAALAELQDFARLSVAGITSGPR
jgi:hypothetical protein